MNFGLPETVEIIRDQVRRFAEREITPLADQIDRENIFPLSLWKTMGELGVLGVTVSETYGGAGHGYLAHAVAMEEISRASASVGLSYGAHSNLCVNQIFLNGTDEQKQQYLPRLISGEHIGALAMSEHNAGSDVVGMQLSAHADGDDFILNGTKMWITNGPDAQTYIIYAKTDQNASSRGITAFIVDRDTPVSSFLKNVGCRGRRYLGRLTLVLVF